MGECEQESFLCSIKGSGKAFAGLGLAIVINFSSYESYVLSLVVWYLSRHG